MPKLGQAETTVKIPAFGSPYSILLGIAGEIYHYSFRRTGGPNFEIASGSCGHCFGTVAALMVRGEDGRAWGKHLVDTVSSSSWFGKLVAWARERLVGPGRSALRTQVRAMQTQVRALQTQVWALWTQVRALRTDSEPRLPYCEGCRLAPNHIPRSLEGLLSLLRELQQSFSHLTGSEDWPTKSAMISIRINFFCFASQLRCNELENHLCALEAFLLG